MDVLILFFFTFSGSQTSLVRLLLCAMIALLTFSTAGDAMMCGIVGLQGSCSVDVAFDDFTLRLH